MRLLLAAATGAAVFATGTATAFATQTSATAVACALNTADVTAITFGDAYVPLKDDATVDFEATLKDAWKLVEGKVDRNITAVTAEFQRVGETAWNSATIEALPAVPAPPAAGTTPTLPTADVKLKGSFKVTKDNKDGNWQVRLHVSRSGASSDSCKEVTVSPQVKYVSASVTDPVVVSAGEETEVVVKANVVGASSVTARLFSNDSNDSVDLELSKSNTANQWYRETWFDDDYATGSWTLELVAARGKESVKIEKADTFWVQTGTSKSKKAKSKVSFDVSANKVKKGKKVRLYGKVYRGSSAYSGKMIELYSKKKGSASWKFAYFVKANGSGKFSKTVKPKTDAYWRAQVPGTSKTYGSKSGYEFVDVR
ncbi:hypothetical protein [Streptosporangium roseum]|uniref:Uncharacterized protein n=1 Tax=Streptosporangium roseum (strain ATCC 12428 / DSM 43021 / JCM 3005 / KCTC 9067 / NCIMB 10171 / NRRL 2505 / NI 9100) TaxID=479432 RepID=D2ARW6_STRRD|nr:hypothetical protein [Streptosporangium roseum]ACZ84645.1 hypothetical protein Sros_1654 [Streptosporangium roseum DSM 43021]